MSTDPSPTTDIPAHFKMYNLYMLVPRDTGKVTLIAGKIQVRTSRWDFGKFPAASARHAINSVWDRIPHKGPALLGADGQPTRYRTICKRDMLAEEVAATDVSETKTKTTNEKTDSQNKADENP